MSKDTKRTIAGVEIPEEFGREMQESSDAPWAIRHANQLAVQELQERVLRVERILLQTAGAAPRAGE